MLEKTLAKCRTVFGRFIKQQVWIPLFSRINILHNTLSVNDDGPNCGYWTMLMNKHGLLNNTHFDTRER